MKKLDSITFPVCSTKHYVREGSAIHSEKQSYKGQVDYFGVYCFELDKCYLVPIDDVGLTQCNLRVLPSKNNQSKRIKWAKDYEI